MKGILNATTTKKGGLLQYIQFININQLSNLDEIYVKLSGP